MTRSRRKTLDGLRRVRDVEERAARNELLRRQAEVVELERRRDTVEHLRRESEELGGALGDGLALGLGSHLARIDRLRTQAEGHREHARDGWRSADSRLRAVDSWIERIRNRERREARRAEQIRLEELARVGRSMRDAVEQQDHGHRNNGGTACRSA